MAAGDADAPEGDGHRGHRRVQQQRAGHRRPQPGEPVRPRGRPGHDVGDIGEPVVAAHEGASEHGHGDPAVTAPTATRRRATMARRGPIAEATARQATAHVIA